MTLNPDLVFKNFRKSCLKIDDEAIKDEKRCHENISVQGSDTTMKP